MTTPQQPRLGPAWRGKGTGFQPPPAVPDAKREQRSSSDRKNPFSALDDDEQPPSSSNSNEGGRFSSLSSRGGFHRSASSGQSKPRSLADLAAAAPPRRSTMSTTSHGVGSEAGEKVIRYTREKLLSLRPRPKDGEGLPDCLKELEGSVVVSLLAQDPGKFIVVSWRRDLRNGVLITRLLKPLLYWEQTTQ